MKTPGGGFFMGDWVNQATASAGKRLAAWPGLNIGDAVANSARWKPSGSLTRTRCFSSTLDLAGTSGAAEADQGAWASAMTRSAHEGEAGGDAAHGGVGEPPLM
ncbi:hypothetical protein FQA39_LY19236 [Lamprigera yunnana]|nr:hypothetical protein FQA39_LY19236 [Lamprigera yunnana]